MTDIIRDVAAITSIVMFVASFTLIHDGDVNLIPTGVAMRP